MKINSNFDEQVKQMLGNYEPAVPSYVWENIQNKSRRKPRGIWFYFKNYGWIPALLLCFGYLGWNFFSTTESSKSLIISSSESKAPNNTSASKSHHSNIAHLSNQANSNSATDASEINNAVSAQSTFSLSQNNNKKHLTKAGALQKASINAIEDQIVSARAIPSSYSSSPKNKYASSARRKMHQQQAAVESIVETTTTTTELSTDDNTLPLLNTEAPSILSLSKKMPLTVKGITRKEMNIPCPGGGNPAWNKQYIEVYASPDYVFRQLHDTAASSEYLNQRKQSTSFYYAYSAGFSYTKVWENGLSCKIGLNYSRVTEKFDYTQGNIIQIIYVTDANGDTIGNYQTTSARHKVTFNKYRTIDVPLMLGYETSNGNWTFNFSAGAIINIHSWSRGELLDRSLQPININSGEQSNPYQMRSNIGLGATASASAYYQLKDRLKIFAAPYFRYNFSSMNSSELALQQRFQTAGIRFGIRFDLGKK